jgi:hypothetical protein
VGHIQLEVIEDFLSQATRLPTSRQMWFKNSKVEEVSWTLFFTSQKINGCDKGMPVSLLKARWHGLLAVLKQFVTCEGCFGLVFLYHLRLLMNFIGFVGQLRGGVNQLLPCLNNYASFKLFAETLNDDHNNAGK